MAAAVPFIMAGLSVASSVQGSQADSQQAEYQAQSLERQAAVSRDRGAAEERLIRDQKPVVEGQIQASAAASGIEVGTGSALDVLQESAFNIEMDALAARENQYQQANVLETEAAYARAGKPSGLSTLMGGAGAGMSGYSQGQMFTG